MVKPADSPDPSQNEDVLYLSSEDERANVATHGLGIALSLLAGAYFWRATEESEIGLRVCCLLFSTSMTVVYAFSTLSHAVHEPKKRNRMRAWDQGTIYFLIVGTYSPFIWEGSSETFRSVLLATVWLLACLGFYSKVLASHRINSVATLTYLALGWLPAIPLISTTPGQCFLWMLFGGLSYSVGVIFLKMSSRIRYSHAAWHIMVMLGSACHVYAVSLLLL